MPPLLSQFSDKHRSVKLTLHSGSSAEVEELLLTTEIDLAILTNPTIASASFNIESWRREPLTAFVRSSNPLAKKTIQISESDEIRLVIRMRKDGQSSTERELRGFATKDAKFKTLMHCASSDSVKEIVRHGTGVGILYHDTVKREIDQGEFKVVRISGLDVARQSYIVYSKERPLSAHAREFLALLRASVPTDLRSKAIASQVPNRTVKRETANHLVRSNLLY